jgi:geranylgeranyl diphosphate synthase type I
MSFEDQLNELRTNLNKRLELFFAKINAKDKFIDLTYKALSSYIMMGGKRLRPSALVMSYKGFGGMDDEIFDVALSVEFMHNSSLVHDDIMDEDTHRRNQPTIHEIMRKSFFKLHEERNHHGGLFNNFSSRFAATNAICDGNILFSLGSLFLSSSRLDAVLVQKALKVYSNAYRVINQGQIIDILFEIKNKVTEEDYLDMISQKTGELFKASTKIGAILAGAKESEIELMSEYSMLVASAFQIQDDIMDISPEMEKGHELGSDIRRGKKTLLMIKAFEKAKGLNKRLLEKIIKNETINDEEINRVIDFIKHSGSLDYCQRLATNKVYDAKKILGKIHLKKDAYDFFNGLADYVLERTI